MNALPAPEIRPTHVRYLTVGLGTSMSILLYLDRYAVSPITSTLLTDLKINKEQLGRTMFFAFFIAYALSQIPAGWLSDKFGARRTLALYVAGWSLATIGMGLVNGLVTVFVARFALGVTQAGAYPAAASLLKRWIPYRARGAGNAIVGMGGRVGSLLAFFITARLAELVGRHLGWETGGWRIVLFCYGGMGLAWVGLFAWLYRDSPRAHPRCNEQEAELIERGSPASESQPSQPPERRFDLPLRAIILNRNVILFCLINFTVNVGWVFLVSWLPQYLQETYGAYLKAEIGDREIVASWMTAVIGIGGITGTILGGLATDGMVAAFGSIWGRRLPGVSSGFLVVALYLIASRVTNVWWFVATMLSISLLIDFGLGALWACYQDIGGRNVAAILGTANMFGGIGAALYTWLIGELADHNHWNVVFLLSAGAMVVCTICWALIDPTRPIE